MTEPDVALTDYGLAIECALFAWWLAAKPGVPALRRSAIVFFLALVVASLAGGTVHGFFLDMTSAGHRILWPVTLIAIGVAAVAALMIAGLLSLREPGARAVKGAALAGLAVYTVVILFIRQSFIVAIIFYLPAAMFLLLVFVSRSLRRGERASLLGAVGMVLTFAASGVQIARIAIHPVYFNHNALYHAIQAVALALVYCSLRRLASSPAAA